MKLDIFNHIFPKTFFDKAMVVLPNGKDMFKRVREIPSIVDLDERFRIMDKFGDDYAQILSLGSPPLEAFGPPETTRMMAKLANDGMAELVSRYPDRFPGFVASLPMNDIGGAIEEAKRAIDELGAVGVQVFSNINGRPLYTEESAPLFDLMAQYDRPIWLHPARGADFADYRGESKSHYEIWWTFGWPYETSTAMAHMVFGGMFDRNPDIKVIAHHLGAMIPYFEGRVGPGWDQLGSRTSDEDYSPILGRMKAKGLRPVDYFHKFHADTAVFGSLEATKCGLKFFGVQNTVFASDMPFDPEKGSAYIRWTIEILDRLELSPADRHAIFEGNARRLCKLDK